jgi:hypothetical protein
MAEFESVVDYSTKLDNFEGPLDLLLHLIKEAKIEIKDVFVSQVTQQFLQYMNGVNHLDVDKASEYLNMASTLLEIKSKALLPTVSLIFLNLSFKRINFQFSGIKPIQATPLSLYLIIIKQLLHKFRFFNF